MTLKIENVEAMPKRAGSPTNFTGSVSVERVAAAPDGATGAGRVTFEQGARTFWHVHSQGQVLYFLEGHGRVQQRGQPPVDAGVGDVVEIPPMAEHWHGAHSDEPRRMRHLAITFGEVTWLDPVADADYRAK